MPDTTSKQKYGKPIHFDNAYYYETSRFIQLFDDDGQIFIVMMTMNNGDKVLHFNEKLYDLIEDFMNDRAIKLVKYDKPNTPPPQPFSFS